MSKTIIGFSTGALAFGNLGKGIQLSSLLNTSAIELSALRESELSFDLDLLDLSSFNQVSIHAPSKFHPNKEKDIVDFLLNKTKNYNIIVHPDIINDFNLWKRLENRLIIENMDNRKPIGRNSKELECFLKNLPNAGFCLDLGHSRQIDQTMGLTLEMLKNFKDRLREIHISDVDNNSYHQKLSSESILDYKIISNQIPNDIPIIIESVFAPNPLINDLEKEIIQTISIFT